MGFTKFNIGKFDRKIKLISKTLQADEFGSLNVQTTTELTVWAYIRVRSNARLFTEAKEFQGTIYDIYVRFQAVDISNIVNYTIVFGGLNLKIRTFENVDNRGEYLKLTCTHG
jgi:SPP1 family predicted phage head-tail adaptor